MEIYGSGKYLPSKIIASESLDALWNLPKGTVELRSGVVHRHYADDESATDMAVKAIYNALESADLQVADIDCLISASASFDQPLPCSAALIKGKLGEQIPAFPAFDVDSTCLGFVVAMDIAESYIQANRYQNILIVTSEIASKGLNYKQIESASLFGDGAAAFIVGPSKGQAKPQLTMLETYAQCAHHTEIRGGGLNLMAWQYNEDNKEDFLFDMNGPAIFSFVSKHMPSFIKRLFGNAMSFENIDMVVPHQASIQALERIRRKLNIPEHKFSVVIQHMGNTIASSIPLCLHESISQGKIKRGDTVFLLGVSAGLTIGGLVFEY